MVVINHSKSGMKANRGVMATTTTATTIINAPALPIYSHEVGKDLIPELAMRVYRSYLDSFREAISNAFDENSQKVVVALSNDKIVIEDWGNGIKDYNEFRKFGQASKKSRKGEVIGEKGLGKLSLLNLGKVVCFETNNGKEGMKFYMTLNGFSSPIYKKSTTAFVLHRGTRITITKPANTFQIDELRAYLKRAFGLRIAQGATIIINNQSIKPGASLEPTEQFLFNLTKVKDAQDTKVTGNLRAAEDGKGIVDLYIDHVFVTSFEVDTRRKFDGWVNCNALTPETSRNNIVQNGIYREFIYLLRRYASRFPLREISIDEHKLMLRRELNSLLKNYLKDMRINVHGRSHINIHENSIAASKSATTFQTCREGADGSTLEDSKRALGIIQNASDASTNLLPSVKRQKQQQQEGEEKNTLNNISVVWEFADLGNEKEPIYFVPPNIIYCNTSNDLYKFAMKKNRHYGPTWIRMLPYLARIAVAMSSESISRVSPEQLNTRIDEATRYFLRQKKVI
jgi:Histidine kinase-, DNA gyrase B-, and HSP90-like ATPase